MIFSKYLVSRKVKRT